MARTRQGWTPLHLAAMKKNLEAISALLNGNPDPNAKDREDKTPLHMAALSNDPATIALLAAAGADLNACTSLYLYNLLAFGGL